MLGGCLPETENKRICIISGLKSGRGLYRNWVVVPYKRALETVFNWETKRLSTKWSLTGGGPLREVVGMRELTVLTKLIEATEICWTRGIPCILYSATNSTGATQHWSATHRSSLQQRSLALVVDKPIKNENISLNFKVSVLSVASVEFVAL